MHDWRASASEAEGGTAVEQKILTGSTGCSNNVDNRQNIKVKLIHFKEYQTCYIIFIDNLHSEYII